jgi:ABC-2 type transport system ATP-binding protein
MVATLLSGRRRRPGVATIGSVGAKPLTGGGPAPLRSRWSLPLQAIRVRDLRKRYADVEAVRGVDLEVWPGEVFGLLGPNGAGKTSIIEILEGLRPRSAGDVEVLGVDPERDSKRLRERIGVCLQATNLPDRIKVREAIDLFASFYERRADADALLARLELTAKAGAFYQHLSGGQKQRLALALALVNEPELLFLDEPTAGLDPQARRAIHDLIRATRAEGRTVVLTTHYIEEAERLCDRVAIVDGGRVIASGAPSELTARAASGAVIDVRWADPLEASAVIDADLESAGGRAALHADRLGATLTAERPARPLAALLCWMDQRGLALTDLKYKKPTLEDVFIELTGRRLRDE